MSTLADELRDNRAAEYGYREVSRRDLNLAVWAQRKEARCFAALVNRLRVRKWTVALRAEGGARLESHRARLRAWYRLPRVRARAQAAQRRRRREAYARNPVVYACEECGATWCRVPWAQGGPTPHFCDAHCQRRARYRQRKAAAGGAVRGSHCRVCGEAGHNARRHAASPMNASTKSNEGPQ